MDWRQSVCSYKYYSKKFNGSLTICRILESSIPGPVTLETYAMSAFFRKVLKFVIKSWEFLNNSPFFFIVINYIELKCKDAKNCQGGLLQFLCDDQASLGSEWPLLLLNWRTSVNEIVGYIFWNPSFLYALKILTRKKKYY